MSATPKKRALVLRPFQNAATKEKFKKHDKPLIDVGAFASFNAAGLVDDAPVARPPRKVKPKSAAKQSEEGNCKAGPRPGSGRPGR